MSDVSVYRIYTYHGTQIFLNGKQIILHRDSVTASYRLYPLYAHMVDGGVELFTIRDNRFKYIRALEGRRTAESEESTVLEYIRNDDDTISIKLGDRFLSAHQRNEELVLQPHNLSWEHFTLERAEFELTSEYIPPLVTNFTPTEEVLSREPESKAAVPAISVIIPMYNVEEYIEECLTSVLNQTFGDYEVIVVDDCSTDGSAQIVEGMIARFDGRLKLIRLPRNNGEPGTPRNIGINCAIGKYIYFMDSDDMIKEDAFETLYKAAEENNADVVYSGMCDYLLNNGKIRSIDLLKLQKTIFVPYDAIRRARAFYSGLFGESPWRRFVRRTFIVKNELYFPSMWHSEDKIFSMYCAVYAKKYVFLPHSFYIYRMRDDSITHVKTPLSDVFYKHLKCLNVGFGDTEKHMNRLFLFINNCHLRYLMFRYVFGRLLGGTGIKYAAMYYDSNPMTNSYVVIYKMLSTDITLHESLIAYCLSAVDIQSKELAMKDRYIDKLNYELQSLKGQ